MTTKIQRPSAVHLVNDVKASFESFTELDFEAQLRLVRDEVFPTEDNKNYHQTQSVISALITILREDKGIIPLAENIQKVCNGFMIPSHDGNIWHISCDSFSCHFPAFGHLDFEDMSLWVRHCNLADKYLRDIVDNCSLDELQKVISGCCIILVCFVPEYRQYWNESQGDNEKLVLLILYAFAVCVAFTNWQAFNLNQLLQVST
jgi:hypothetical protein